MAAAAAFPGSLSAMQLLDGSLHLNGVSDEPTSTQGVWAGLLCDRLLKTGPGSSPQWPCSEQDL